MWCIDLVVPDKKNIFARSLTYVAVQIKQNRFVVTVALTLLRCQNRIEVVACSFGKRWSHAVMDAPPRRDTCSDAFALKVFCKRESNYNSMSWRVLCHIKVNTMQAYKCQWADIARLFN